MKSVKDNTRSFLVKCLVFTAFGGMLVSCQSGEPAESSAEKENESSQTAAVAQSSADAAPAGERPPRQETQTLMVYYFHTTARCYSCNMIENLTKDAVETGFPDDLEKGRIQFKAVNIESSGNEHFAEDYKLYTKSVVLSQRKDGKEAQWKNLDQVWTLLRDKEKFTNYITREVKAML